MTFLGILNMNMMIVLFIKLEMVDGRGLYELCMSHCVLVMPSMSLLLFNMYIDVELEHPIGMKKLLAQGRNRIGEMG